MSDYRMTIEITGVGTCSIAFCRECAQPIYWPRYPGVNRVIPYNANGTSHLLSCVGAPR